MVDKKLYMQQGIKKKRHRMHKGRDNRTTQELVGPTRENDSRYGSWGKDSNNFTQNQHQ